MRLQDRNDVDRLTPWLVAGVWTALVIAGAGFWWPLLLVSWHYWFGGGG